MSSFALTIIAGPGLGREMPLLSGREMVIGRVEGVDFVVVENNISRQHAALTATENTVQIRDLGSRNGTFLNGQRITKATLKEGDEITMGRCRLKLVTLVTGRVPPFPAKVVAPMEPNPKHTVEMTMPVPKSIVPPSSPSNATSETREGFRGSLAEIRLESVLQLLGSTRKSGLLLLRSGTETGRIFLQDGRVYYACMEDWVDVEPRKILYRLLRWTTGTFELEKSDVRVFDNPITESTDALLLEGLRQLDELAHLGDNLPPMDATVTLATPLPVRLAELEKRDLDFLQSVVDFRTVQRILDHFHGSDFEGYAFLQGMLTRGILTITPCQSHAEPGRTESHYSSSTAQQHA